MKKIVSAAMVAAMAAGFATAEVTVSLNARVRPDLYKIEGFEENDSKNLDSYTKTTYADLDGFAEPKDTFYVKGKTDFAGVVAEVYYTMPTATNNDGKVTFDNYYAWVNWGALKFTGGVYDSRYTSRGNYTATEQGILDEEFSKTEGLSQKNGLAGSAFGKKTYLATLNWLSDFGNMAQSSGNANALSFLADYTFNDIGGGTLLLKGGLIENSTKVTDSDTKEVSYNQTIYDDTTSTTEKDKDVFVQSDGYAFEAAWRRDDLVALDFIFKNPVHKAYGFALYVTPLMIPNTKNVVLGFTYGTQEDQIKSAFAVDLRGQYNITPQATFALSGKYEYLKTDLDKDIQLVDSDGKKNDIDNWSAMQIAGEFSYKFNDIVTAAFDIGYFNQDLTDEDDNDDDGTQFIVTSLRGKFSAGKNAAITTAVCFKDVLNPADGKTDYVFNIPVVLRVKM